MNIQRLLVLLFLAAGPLLAQAQSDTSTDFANRAKKLREMSLLKMEPQVVLSSNTRPRVGGNRVLMIGDSLSVGAFGETLGNYLVSRFGRGNVAAYAAGGSSPQSWMASEPDYITKCGYREQTPFGTQLIDYQNGRRPRPVNIPKIEGLISKYRPTVIIVQQGTNWMDGLSVKPTEEYTHDSEVMDRFIAVLRSRGGENRQIIWIAPPDSAKFSNRVQRAVETIIKDAAHKYAFETVSSRSMTHYITGKTGGDGVHYNSEASEAWAKLVARDLDRKIR